MMNNYQILFISSSGTTESIFGPTKNNWGSRMTPPAMQNVPNDTKSETKIKEDFFIAGGSSGGSAVAVACGTCVA